MAVDPQLEVVDDQLAAEAVSPRTCASSLSITRLNRNEGTPACDSSGGCWIPHTPVPAIVGSVSKPPITVRSVSGGRTSEAHGCVVSFQVWPSSSERSSRLLPVLFCERFRKNCSGMTPSPPATRCGRKPARSNSFVQVEPASRLSESAPLTLPPGLQVC